MPPWFKALVDQRFRCFHMCGCLPVWAAGSYLENFSKRKGETAVLLGNVAYQDVTNFKNTRSTFCKDMLSWSGFGPSWSVLRGVKPEPRASLAYLFWSWLLLTHVWWKWEVTEVTQAPACAEQNCPHVSECSPCSMLMQVNANVQVLQVPNGSKGWLDQVILTFQWVPMNASSQWIPNRRFRMPVAWRVAQNSRINSLKWQRFSWQNPSQWLSSPVPESIRWLLRVRSLRRKSEKKTIHFRIGLLEIVCSRWEVVIKIQIFIYIFMYKYDIYKYLMYVPMIWYHITSAHIISLCRLQPAADALDEQTLITYAIGFQMAPASAPEIPGNCRSHWPTKPPGLEDLGPTAPQLSWIHIWQL